MTPTSQSASQMKRGFVRLFILANLYRQPLHGYGIIQTIEARSNGFWSPKPGNIYPLMKTMADEKLIEVLKIQGRRKVYGITEQGKEELLHLFSEAEDAIIHLVKAMNRNDAEWIHTHVDLLDELEPENREERLRSILSTLDSLIDVLSNTRDKLADILDVGKGGVTEEGSGREEV